MIQQYNYITRLSDIVRADSIKSMIEHNCCWHTITELL